jgi:hypothetical protein
MCRVRFDYARLTALAGSLRAAFARRTSGSLEELFPAKPLIGATPLERAETRQWTRWIDLKYVERMTEACIVRAGPIRDMYARYNYKTLLPPEMGTICAEMSRRGQVRPCETTQFLKEPCLPAPWAKRVAPSRVSPERITSMPSSVSSRSAWSSGSSHWR